MYAKGKSNNVPSDSQAREKLALYVYEYLLHVGAQKSAQTFLSERRLVGGAIGGQAHCNGWNGMKSKMWFPYV
uniref:Single stranded DNA binding protein 2a n=1 Tax=Oncorhynchus kisutch TaxID=8019 RepID=A0A8C7IR03_ONCKI